jgi:transmembrane sensor
MAEARTGPLAEQIHHVVTEREVDEAWLRLDSALRPERRLPRWAPIAGLLGLAAAAAVVMAMWPRAGQDGTVLEPGATIATGQLPLTGRLQEGSTIEADAVSAGEVEFASASEVRVRLDRGTFRFDVAKKPTRRFLVMAGRIEVRVVGTTFTVRRETSASVRVERGVVEVWVEGTQRAVLTAGQSWDEAPLASAASERAPEPVVVEPAPVEPAPVETVESEPRPTRAVRPVRRTSPRAAAPSAPEPLPSSITPVTLPDDPSTLFKVALDARRAGRASEAAQALQQFVARFPDDSRAGLALFELGRLEMDQLRSPSRAIDSLARSVAKAPSGAFVEDALARITRLHHDLKHADACRAAKDTALKRFPSGVHAATLGGLCSF